RGRALRAEELGEQAVAEVGRPGDADARLEVVLVPLVERRAPVGWPREVEGQRRVEVEALAGGGDAAVEVVRERDVRLDLEPLGLVDGAAQRVAQAVGERQ